MTVQQEATQGIVLTDGAAAKVSSLLSQEGRDDLRLRIAVQPGGCSGLRYQLYFDEREIDGDIVAEFGTVPPAPTVTAPGWALMSLPAPVVAAAVQVLFVQTV